MNKTENRIVFRDHKGILNNIRIERITYFEIPFIYMYRVRFVKTDGTPASESLDPEDPENYIVYRGVKYTNEVFQKLVLVLKNENNLAVIEELD